MQIAPSITPLAIDPYALHHAIKTLDLGGIRELIAGGADLDRKNAVGCAPVHIAASIGSVEVLEILKESGTDFTILTDWKSSALDFAAERGNVPAIEWLINQFPLLKKCSAPLLYAAGKGHLVAIRWLLKHDVSFIDTKANNGSTGLHWAAANGHIPTIEYLFGYKPSLLFLQDNSGATALHWAVEKGQILAIKHLLRHFTSLSAVKDNYGQTALHWAVCYDKKNITELLLNLRVNKLIVDSDCYTPYLKAVSLGHYECASIIGSDLLSEKIKLLKIIGHISHIKAEIDLSENIKLPTEYFDQPIFCQEWSILFSQKKEDFYPLLKDVFECAAKYHLLSSEEIMNEIHSKFLVILPLRTWAHSFSLVFYWNSMTICDGGRVLLENGDTFKHYFFNPLKITAEIIDELRSDATYNNGCNYFYELLSQLELVENKSFSERLPMPKHQKIANCSYVSSEIALFVALQLIWIEAPVKLTKRLCAELLKKVLTDWETLCSSNSISVEHPSLKDFINQAKTELTRRLKKIY